MKRLKLCLAALLAAACLLGGIVRAEGALAYRGEITLIDACKPEKKKGDLENGPALCFEALVNQWQEAHPDIRINEKKRTGGETGVLARMDHLPDVFVADAAWGRTFAQYGCIADLSEAVVESQYFDMYDRASLSAYLYYGRMAAFPMLAKSHALVLYDRRAWAEAGLDGFPKTLNEAGAQAAILRERGYKGMIAFGSADGTQAVRCVVGPLLQRDQGEDIFRQMVDEDAAASFRDGVFIRALEEAEAMLTGDIFPDLKAELDAEGALSGFIKGDYPALLTSGENVYAALDRIREDAPELYDALAFGAMPAAKGEADVNYVPSGITYGLYINAYAVQDPERFEACVDLCRYLTGPDYADMMARLYGRQCFTRASDEAWQAFYDECDDGVLVRLARFINDEATACVDITQYLHGAVWSDCGENLLKRLKAARTGKYKDVPGWEEIANTMQNDYERYYYSAPAAEDAMAGQ